MQFSDLGFSRSEKPYAGEPKPLQQSRYVLLIPGQAIERLGHNNVELPAPRILKKRLIGRPQSLSLH